MIARTYSAAVEACTLAALAAIAYAACWALASVVDLVVVVLESRP